MNPLQQAIRLVGWIPLAGALNVTHQAIRKWVEAGRLPRSEFSGETSYSQTIEQVTSGEVTAEQLLIWSRKGWSSHAA